jgi:hypothetical protein
VPIRLEANRSPPPSYRRWRSCHPYRKLRGLVRLGNEFVARGSPVNNGIPRSHEKVKFVHNARQCYIRGRRHVPVVGRRRKIRPDGRERRVDVDLGRWTVTQIEVRAARAGQRCGLRPRTLRDEYGHGGWRSAGFKPNASASRDSLAQSQVGQPYPILLGSFPLVLRHRVDQFRFTPGALDPGEHRRVERGQLLKPDVLAVHDLNTVAGRLLPVGESRTVDADVGAVLQRHCWRGAVGGRFKTSLQDVVVAGSFEEKSLV